MGERGFLVSVSRLPTGNGAGRRGEATVGPPPLPLGGRRAGSTTGDTAMWSQNVDRRTAISRRANDNEK